jgi:hypothetical protein
MDLNKIVISFKRVGESFLIGDSLSWGELIGPVDSGKRDLY